jgi:hypothetical protein
MPPRYSRDQLADAVAESFSISETLRNLGMCPAGGSHAVIKKYLVEWDIDASHFDSHHHQRFGGKWKSHATPLSEIMVEDSTYRNRVALKERLYREGIKQRFCELCSQDEIWNGRRMALILDHINGISDDNRLENLRIVCANCNATLDTHCGRNIRE